MRNSMTVGLEWDIEIIHISTIEWRVRDSSRPEHDPDSLCGIVIRSGDLYEAMSMKAPLVRRYFDSLDSAAMFLAPMWSLSTAQSDLQWVCPRRGTLVAFKDGHSWGVIAHTEAGFEAVDAQNRHIGTFNDFMQAESRLARVRTRTPAHNDESASLSPIIAIMTAVMLTSAAAIGTIAALSRL